MKRSGELLWAAGNLWLGAREISEGTITAVLAQLAAQAGRKVASP